MSEQSVRIGRIFEIEVDVAILLANPTLRREAITDDSLMRDVGYLERMLRHLTALRIVLAAGFDLAKPIPSSAEGALQGLVRCRTMCPQPGYDPQYRVVVRQGRALVVEAMGCRNYDKNYFEIVAGAYDEATA